MDTENSLFEATMAEDPLLSPSNECAGGSSPSAAAQQPDDQQQQPQPQSQPQPQPQTSMAADEPADASSNVKEENSAQLFCLRWNNYQSNLTNVFDQLLQNESFVDVTLACGDGHTVKAHKMVLSACSPYFQSLFFENPCKHPIVILKDIKWSELKAAVEFMYKGEINVCQDQIGPLLKVAESLRIRGLADVNNEHDLNDLPAPPPPPPSTAVSNVVGCAASSGGTNSGSNSAFIGKNQNGSGNGIAGAANASRDSPDQLLSRAASKSSSSSLVCRTSASAASQHHHPPKKRRKTSASASAVDRTAADDCSVQNSPSAALELVTSPSLSPSAIGATPTLNTIPSILQACHQNSLNSLSHSQSSSPPLPLSSSHAALSSLASGILPSLPSTSSLMMDDMEIKPGIAEMIREEERAKMLESSQAWLNASANSLTSDNYQYQLQSMWQKCWSTNQSLVHNLRFRERGPLKSWRPETMAEAILSVLKEGLSLSQAARKYDIPYPTFVLYANRVHNMLGPSADGGSDLRPKGRGRPQRILLGFWPEDHIQNVIRTVVFRDQQHIKDEPLNLVGYPRLGETLSMYGNGSSCMNSPEHPSSPNSTAAAVVAMAQGLRQQMLAAAAVAHNSADANFGFFSQCSNGAAPPSLLMTTPIHSPHSTPPNSPSSNSNLEVALGMSGGLPFKSNDAFPMGRTESLLFQEEIEDLVMKTPRSHSTSSTNEQHQPLPLVLDQRAE